MRRPPRKIFFLKPVADLASHPQFAIGDGGRGMREVRPPAISYPRDGPPADNLHASPRPRPQQFDGSDEPWPKHIFANYQAGDNVGQYEARQLQGKRRAFEQVFLAAWRAAGLDFILSPAYHGPPPPHGTHRNGGGTITNTLVRPSSATAALCLRRARPLADCLQYRQFWNLMDYPAITLPVLRGDATLDAVGQKPVPLSDTDAAVWDACALPSPSLDVPRFLHTD